MGTPQQRISPSKESRSRQIQKLKTQENQDLPTAFLQNRILAPVKSQRQINRFRILHGRLLALSAAPASAALFTLSENNGIGPFGEVTGYFTSSTSYVLHFDMYDNYIL